jgi:hypothetical protein
MDEGLAIFLVGASIAGGLSILVAAVIFVAVRRRA